MLLEWAVFKKLAVFFLHLVAYGLMGKKIVGIIL